MEVQCDETIRREPDKTAQENSELGAPAGGLTGSYEVRVSEDEQDSEWDDFLAGTPGNHHVQSSLWCQVKSCTGCRPLRVVVTKQGRIVAGAQMLVRRWKLVGAAGYLHKGPIAAAGQNDAATLLVEELIRAAKERSVRWMAAQPGDHDHWMVDLLGEHGYRPSPVAIAPTATCVLDLSPDEDTLMANMKSRTRYNVRLAARKGVTVREGDESDLPTYHRLLAATGERQGFRVFPEEYYRRMWRAFQQRRAMRLALAEYAGEVVAGQVAIGFGDTVINKMSVWSGKWPQHRPNELLQWNAIQWAKRAGYLWYDFDGIKTEAAQAIVRGQPLPDEFRQTVTSFKLGFGAQPLLMPGTYDYVPSRPLRWAYRNVLLKMMKPQELKDAVYRLRTAIPIRSQ